MNNKNQAANQLPHIRYWKHGQISGSAKERIDTLLICGQANDARSMAAEWIIDIRSEQNEQSNNLSQSTTHTHQQERWHTRWMGRKNTSLTGYKPTYSD